ncbi:aminotransferase class IV [Sediminicola luteus]|uniref:Aminotransferase IV n=1 Tax=Sediminicola luteus TaxID=319238 RepID=A0A2A4GD27_9FLAO|nr:aminotransferase class IV [Sediminicola luteus]PCE66517.1 aminotransferase IV [Sediminicola luteus]
MPNYPSHVWLNGAVLPAEAAKISVFDRGFLFGDGIYEVMVRLQGRFFYGEAHWERLERNLEKIGIAYSVSLLRQNVSDLAQVAGLLDQDVLLYIQVSRGTAPRQHAFPKDITPTAFMYLLPFSLPDVNTKRMEVSVLPDQRWERCDIKMTSLLGNVMAKDSAVTGGAHEAVLVRNGKITEGSHSNVFFVKDGELFTHPKNRFILDGITRDITLELAGSLGIPVREEAVAQIDISQMDEAFLTGTSTQIAAIGRMGTHTFFEGSEIGPITQRLQQAFLALKNQ